MDIAYALILACDLLPDGSNIGPITKERLRAGLDHCATTGDKPVVAAAFSPRHPSQRIPMSFMMEDWLCLDGYVEVEVLVAKAFNTRGELSALSSLKIRRLTIISGAAHLERVKILVEKMQQKGLLQQMDVMYVPANTQAMTERGMKLEGIKKSFIRYTPFWFQDSVMYLLHKTPLRHINLSY